MLLSPTPDIHLHILAEKHSGELFDLLHRNRRYLREWLPWLDTQKKSDDSLQFIKAVRSQFERNESVTFGIRYRETLCGIISLHRIDWPNRATMIGYWIAEDFQGRGIVTESCKAMLDYAFLQLGLHRIEIRCATANRKSRAIPERLGFVSEATLRDAEWLYDHFVDLIVYSMLAPDWKKSHHSSPPAAHLKRFP